MLQHQGKDLKKEKDSEQCWMLNTLLYKHTTIKNLPDVSRCEATIVMQFWQNGRPWNQITMGG